MSQDATREREIKISDLFYHVFRRIWLILAILVISVAAFLLYSVRSYEPIYTATASMVVNAKRDQTYDAANGPSYSDIHLAQDLVGTYTLVLKSDRILQQVIDALALDTTASALRSHISLSSVEKTQVHFLEITHADPDLAVNIANSLIECAPQVMMETVEIGSVNVLDSAVSATLTGMHLLKNGVLGVAVGLVLGVGLALLAGLLFPRVKNPDDIREALTIATLGEIPHASALLTEAPPQLREAFMRLGCGMRYEAETKNLRKILVTSALEGEGKTFVALNLALALCGSNCRVLLIDCDLRKQSVHRRLGIPRDAAENLCTAEDLSKCVVEHAPGLFVVPVVEPTSRRAGGFISSPAFRRALDTLAQQYDYVILDSPPGYSVADTMDLARLSDGVLFVVKQEHAPEKALIETAQRLLGVGATIIGSVLNDIRHTQAGSGYAGKYRYYYRYGETDA